MSACDDGSHSWVMEIESEVRENENFEEKEMGAWKKHSMYKLPKGFVGDEKRIQAYKPQVVSLGPYHHGEEQLQAMEEHKRRTLRHLHVRTKKSVTEYWEAFKEGEMLQQLMDSYKDLDPSWRNDEEGFLKLMILDGCFMLEVMRLVTKNDFKDYADNDPIFSRNELLSNLPKIKRDMLMLENQIPLLVLHKLTAVEKGLIHEQDEQKQWELHQEVNYMVLHFFQQEKMATPPGAAATSTYDHELWGLHVLDVVSQSMIRDIDGGIRRSGDVQIGSCDVIWCAKDLDDAGIRFKRSGSPSLQDITFQTGSFHDALSLPQLLVDDATEAKFLNLMAFEHLHMGSTKEVSSYACFMRNIIRSDKDVSLLSMCNIIKNCVGSDRAIVDLFNSITHDVLVDPAGHLGKVHRDVTIYCNDPFIKPRFAVKRTYFGDPWFSVSLVGSILVFSVVLIQSVYTVFQYYKPN